MNVRELTDKEINYINRDKQSTLGISFSLFNASYLMNFGSGVFRSLPSYDTIDTIYGSFVVDEYDDQLFGSGIIDE